jgi:hypothetical protein
MTKTYTEIMVSHHGHTNFIVFDARFRPLLDHSFSVMGIFNIYMARVRHFHRVRYIKLKLGPTAVLGCDENCQREDAIVMISTRPQV